MDPADLRRAAPPFELVQLSSLPEERWRGLPVFHPLNGQSGDDAGWLSEDPEYRGEAAYDVGVVLDWHEDPVAPGSQRVRFLLSSGATLRYSAWNLWVPRSLV